MIRLGNEARLDLLEKQQESFESASSQVKMKVAISWESHQLWRALDGWVLFFEEESVLSMYWGKSTSVKLL